MKNLAMVSSLILVLTLGSAGAYAGSVPITHGPLFDREWRAAYERGVEIPARIEFDSKPLDDGPLTDAEWVRAGLDGLAIRARIGFDTKPLGDGPLTDEEWELSYRSGEVLKLMDAVWEMASGQRREGGIG